MTTFDEIRQRARQALATDDSERIDQEQARIERARREARRQARQERTQQRVQDARQQERERVLDDLETGVDGRASDDDLDITPGEFDDDIVGGLR